MLFPSSSIPDNNNSAVDNNQVIKAENKRAALYVRVSSEEQARHGGSVADQLQALRQWAKDNGYINPIEYLDEGFSARKSYRTRPALKKLLSDIEDGKVSIVSFTKLDRWFRSLRDYYAVQTILDSHGVGWTAILEEYSTLDTASRLLLNLRLTIAEHEADLTSDRLKFTFSQKRQRGEVVSGSVPIGYRIENKKPVKDEKTFPAVNAFWTEYVSTGRFRAAIDAANIMGGNITCSHAAKMLLNADKYAGTVQSIPTYAYITDEQAQRVLSTRKKRARATGVIHLFNGFIYCGQCGGRMSAHLSTRRTKAAGKIRYTTYFCRRYVDHQCTMKTNLNQNKIEDLLLRDLESALDDYIIQAKAKQANNQQRIDTAEKIKALSDRRKRLVDLYLDAAISKADFEQRRKSIDDDIARLSVISVPEPIKDPERLRKMLPDNWKAIYNDLTDESKRSFWYQLLNRIEVYPDRSIRFTFV